MTNYTNEEKQQALDEAHEIMNPEERLDGIKEYINGAIARFTTPILNEEDLSFLVNLAEKGCRND